MINSKHGLDRITEEVKARKTTATDVSILIGEFGEILSCRIGTSLRHDEIKHIMQIADLWQSLDNRSVSAHLRLKSSIDFQTV